MAAFQSPADHVVSIWRETDQFARDHIKHIWPDLAIALDRLGDRQDAMITEPGSVHVPPLAAPRPARVPRGGSLPRSASLGTEPTSNPDAPRKSAFRPQGETGNDD